MPIVLKSPSEIALMRQAGRINALALQAVSRAVRPGVTTAELDRIAARVIREHGALPAFLGQETDTAAGYPYPATITTSVNSELVHGIPGKRRLREGDIISLDCGTIYEGFVGDSAITLPVGRISPEAEKLVEVTRRALELGIAACYVGNRLGDVSATIQEWVESQGLHVVIEYTGHGVGREMWEDPQIPNWGKRDRGAPLRPGMTFALEPMVTIGPPVLYTRDDLWTVATEDGSLCAHYEHTIAVTQDGPEILTQVTPS
jgi:methionyl aminopeptidase